MKCGDFNSTGYKAGDHVYICIHLLPRELKMVFNITVDEYEILSIAGAYILSASDSIAKNSFLV